jgi:hypothetical protein
MKEGVHFFFLSSKLENFRDIQYGSNFKALYRFIHDEKPLKDPNVVLGCTGSACRKQQKEIVLHHELPKLKTIL